MTRDDIIAMAREAGFSRKHAEVYFDRQLERFAALIAQHEREACAKVCDMEALKWKSPKYNFATASANHCAAAIRARGEEHGNSLRTTFRSCLFIRLRGWLFGGAKQSL